MFLLVHVCVCLSVYFSRIVEFCSFVFGIMVLLILTAYNTTAVPSRPKVADVCKGMHVCDWCCGQSYAQQLQETERRLAKLMRTEQQLRHRHSGTTDQQRDFYDPNVQQGRFLPARLLVVVIVSVCVCVCLSVCHTPVLYRNGCTDRAGFLCIRASFDLCYTVF